MNPETTLKVTEDTNILQRKIIYKDRLLIEYPVMNPLGSNANWTIYYQEDGTSRYAVGSQSVTISQLKYTGNFTIDAIGGLFYLGRSLSFFFKECPCRVYFVRTNMQGS